MEKNLEKTPGFWMAKSGKNQEKIGFGQVFSAFSEKYLFSVQNANTAKKYPYLRSAQISAAL